jgi:hypothetical protein
MHHGSEQPKGIDQDVQLAAIAPLAAIVAIEAALFRGFNRSTVNDAVTGIGRA